VHEVRNMFGAYPRENARSDVSGLGRTAVTRTLMKTEGDLPLMAPKWSGGFVNELLHADFPTRRFIGPGGNNVVYNE
jgi:hypothetical protein